jgi:hypothetical protein
METGNIILNQFKIFIVYSYFLISSIGLVVNIIGFIVFSGKNFQNTVFSVYFRFMLIIDTLGLLIPINRVFEYNLSINFRYLSNFSCKLRMMYTNVVHPISGWILVVISIDRFLSICYPMRFSIRKNKWFQILVINVVLILNLIFYSLFLTYDLDIKRKIINSTNNQTKQSYSISCESNMEQLILFMDLFEASLIPFSLMILFSSLSIRKIFITRKSTYQKKARQKDIRFAIVSIGLDITFLILTLPHYLFFLVTRFSKITNPFLFDFFNSIKFFLYYLNFISVFFTNFLVNSMFRNNLLTLMPFLKRNTNELSYSTKSCFSGISQSIIQKIYPLSDYSA